MRKQAQHEPQSEAERFSELARKLIAVPKKEVDEKKAQYEKEKMREKGKRAK